MQRDGNGGERAINEGQATIVRCIFREYAAGMSPRAIARGPNEDGVPGPSGPRYNMAGWKR